MKSLTHAELVERAGRWVRNSCKIVEGSCPDGSPRYHSLRCDVVFLEMASGCLETPDAIGFARQGLISVLVECKASRADFLSDQKKFGRCRPKYGIGNYRFFMAPHGLLTPDDMPDSWGLLTVKGSRVTIERDAIKQDSYQFGEVRMLFSGCRRLQAAARKKAKKAEGGET